MRFLKAEYKLKTNKNGEEKKSASEGREFEGGERKNRFHDEICGSVIDAGPHDFLNFGLKLLGAWLGEKNLHKVNRRR